MYNGLYEEQIVGIFMHKVCIDLCTCDNIGMYSSIRAQYILND